jgi:hypothetical protein
VPDSVRLIGAQKKANMVARDHTLQQTGCVDSLVISGQTSS